MWYIYIKIGWNIRFLNFTQIILHVQKNRIDKISKKEKSRLNVVNNFIV